jgi:glycosyltransferase involved in cell wall biosynthesis
MKIGLVYDLAYPWSIGGGEKSLYELALELRDRGHEPHLFTMHWWDGPADMIQDGLHYHAVCPRLPIYNGCGRRVFLQPLRFAWGLATRLPRLSPRSFDLFDLQAFPFFSVFAFWAVRLLYAWRVPWILTWLEVWGRPYWRRYLGFAGLIGASIEWLCARLAPVHLCISPTTARRLYEHLGVSKKYIHMIPRGFRPPDRLLNVRDKKPYKVVVVNRLIDYKRVDWIVRAWRRVQSHLPSATLHIIGDGPERGALEQLAAEEGMASFIHFHGSFPEREPVLEMIAGADLLVQPSAREGQSTVVLEAMSLGTAVLAAEGPETAVADFFIGFEGASSMLLPYEATPDRWAESIVHLLRDDDLRRRFVSSCRRRTDQLRWKESIAPRIEALYQSVAVSVPAARDGFASNSLTGI